MTGAALLRDEEPAWREKRRRKIVAAAARLFARSPYELVQMDDVAAAAQVGKSTLYRYFPSKDELFLEICALAFDELSVNLDAAVALPPAKALSQMVAALVDVLANQVASLRLLSGERAPVAEGWRQLYHQQRRIIVEAFRTVLIAGMEQGEFRELDPDLVPRLLVGMIRGGLAMAGPSNRDTLIEATLAIVLNGLEIQSKAEPLGQPGRHKGKRNCAKRRAA